MSHMERIPVTVTSAQWESTACVSRFDDGDRDPLSASLPSFARAALSLRRAFDGLEVRGMRGRGLTGHSVFVSGAATGFNAVNELSQLGQ